MAWTEVWTTLQAEFSDIPDVAQLTRVSLRPIVAAALGGVLGYDRERKGKAAGPRTHMLVCVGAALFVLIPQQSGASVADLSRVLQGVIAGIGFLGAGAIIKVVEQEDAKGLTTAASIWLTAAIGIAAGMGRESSAVLSTFLARAILSLVPRITRLMNR